jgi:hypothetical protein
VCELLVRAGMRRDVMPIALAERWFKAALLPELLVREGFSGAQIAARILERIDHLSTRRAIRSAATASRPTTEIR